MAFTGRIGLESSQLGNIVLGIVDSFELATVGFKVHVLSSTEIRVLFDHAVTNSALRQAAYILTPQTAIVGKASVDTNLTTVFDSTLDVAVNQIVTFTSGVNAGQARVVSRLDPIQGTFEVSSPWFFSDSGGSDISITIPFVESLVFFDADQTSMKLTMSEPLKYQQIYGMQIFGIQDFSGQGVTSTVVNFTANVQDAPRALGAFMSVRGCVDVLFDRSVGPTSYLAGAYIRDAATVGPGQPMTLLDWATQDVRTNIVRFAYPTSVDLADSYAIDYSVITDVSGNQSAGSVALSMLLRTPAPYNFSSLAQVQFIDAFVTDVMGSIDTATVRVYFNCPALETDILNTALWTLTQSGVHPVADTVDSILVPDPVDLPTLVDLCNLIKSYFNQHIVQETVHVQNDARDSIVSANSSNVPTCCTLLTEALTKYSAHLLRQGIHLYPDTVNTISVSNPTNQASAIAVSIQLRDAFNSHLLSDFPIEFSTELPSTIGPIQNWASTDVAFQTIGTHLYFADLRIVLGSNAATVRVRGNIGSEDGGSSTNSSNVTGDIIARSASSIPRLIDSTSGYGTNVALHFDRNIQFFDTSTVAIMSNSSGPIAPLELESGCDLAPMVWTLNCLMVSFNHHLSGSGAGHLSPDTADVVEPSEFAQSPNIRNVCDVANSFRAKFDAHFTSTVYHTNPDSRISSAGAFNEATLFTMLQEMIRKFLTHNASGSNVNPDRQPSPQFPGHHTFPGPSIFSAASVNRLLFRYPSIQDGTVYQVAFTAESSNFSPASGVFEGVTFAFSSDFEGVALRPSVASAVPICGLVRDEEGGGDFVFRLQPDAIQIFFSKPMRQVPLDSSHIMITGGSLTVSSFEWVNSRIVQAIVTGLSPAVYTLSAVGLYDQTGNLVY